MPTTGFFEWNRESTRKRPHFIGMKGDEPFSFAGIWECWTALDGDMVDTCAILTTESNELVGSIHNRMPVILHPDNYDRLLDPGMPPESLEALLIPYPSELMATHEIANIVTNLRYDAPDCIQAMDILNHS
ncbi:MAG: SOS response-associated peptidase [Candidatus Latescibacterota bacterium]